MKAIPRKRFTKTPKDTRTPEQKEISMLRTNAMLRMLDARIHRAAGDPETADDFEKEALRLKEEADSKEGDPDYKIYPKWGPRAHKRA